MSQALPCPNKTATTDTEVTMTLQALPSLASQQSTGAWIPGEPPAGIGAAWLRMCSRHEEGDVTWVELGVRDRDQWNRAVSWVADFGFIQLTDEISHWMPYAAPTPRLDRIVPDGVAEVIRKLEEARNAAEWRHEFTEQWYAVRLEKLKDLGVARGIWDEMAAIIANGTDSPNDPVNYAQLLNMAKFRAETAEKACEAMKADRERLDWMIAASGELTVGNDEKNGWHVFDVRNGQVMVAKGHSSAMEAIDAAREGWNA